MSGSEIMVTITHNVTEVAETVQRLTNEQQSDVEQSMTALRERATRCCKMMDELRPTVRVVLPDN
jgi:hypothetical protein